MLVLERSTAVDEFVRQNCDLVGDWNLYQTIGWMHNGEIVAGVSFTDYTGANIVANIAARPGMYMREFLRAVFRYAFIQAGCRRMTALCAAKNTPAREFVEGLGLQWEGRLRHGLADDDIVIYGLLREECRFLAEVH